MDSLGYIKGLQSEIELAGGVLSDFIPVDNPLNPLNPTACYVITLPANDSIVLRAGLQHPCFTIPGTDFNLEENDGFFLSPQTGLAFPILKAIPVLKRDSAILATALSL